MHNRLIKIVLILTALLAVLGAWFWWRNVYSKEVLKLEILGPSEVEAGSEVSYTVRYKNNGNVRLESPRLIFEYPDNTVVPEEFRKIDGDRVTVRGEGKIEIALDDIQPGEERTENFKGIVFGIENSTISAKAWLEYTPRNLNVRYESETSHTMMISGVPLTFEVHLPSRTEPGKKFTFEVNYFSRIEYPLSNLRVKIDYPSGFEFTESRPKPSFEQNEWEIGVLNRGQGGRIEVSGTLRGDPSQAKVFKATLGFWQNGRFVPLKESTRGIELATPLIFITHQINGRPNYTASPGEYLYYEIFFKNTGDDLLENLFMTVRLSEDVVDFSNVQPGSGNFQRNAGMILWDSTGVSQLRFLPTMEEGKIDFWIKVKDDINIANPAVRAEVSLSHITERITTKIKSKVLLTQKGYFNQGPFNNYGPQPPVVGSSTSYTVHWQIKNYQNELKDAKVRATLAPGTRLSGDIAPDGSRISFDPQSREVVWDIGNIPAGAGITESTPEVFFQIVFDPRMDQRESMVDIVSEAIMTAIDSWTDSSISANYREIRTNLPDDSSISDEMGIVQ